MKQLLLVDASSYIHRAFHASPKRVNGEGFPVGAISTFTAMILKLLRPGTLPERPTHVAIVFEKGGKTFRHKIAKSYKAGRSYDDALLKQMPVCREVVRAAGLPMIEAKGVEADDMIASIAARCPLGCRITIASPDKDLMQVMRPGIVSIYDPIADRENSRGALRTPADVERIFGPMIKPWQIPHVQALAGDTVDNIPGVPGIGAKTAASLIYSAETVHGLLKLDAEQFRYARHYALIQKHAESALLSYDLAKLKTDCDAPPLAELERRDIDGVELATMLRRYHLDSLAFDVERWHGGA